MAVSDGSFSSAWSDIDDQLSSFRRGMSNFSASFDSSLSMAEIDKKIDEISDWVKEQKKSSAKKGVEDRINNVGKVLTSTVNAIDRFRNGDPFEIASGTLDIISSTAVLVGGPYGAVAAAVCSVIGAILSASQPKNTSVVEQLAEVVHNEMVNFNEKLQDQIFTGLNDRIKRQIHFLKKMESPNLEDPVTLWKDYTQFLGEVSERYEKSIPFKFNDDLTKDADVADVVAALMMYCKAYTYLMAFLITAKGKLGCLGDSKGKKMIEQIDYELSFQQSNAKEKLAFLSDGSYLTLLGRLPSEGGKLTKIVALARNRDALCHVEDVRRSLNLTPMADPDTVESAADHVSRQSVKLKLEGHPTKLNSRWMRIQIVNETKFLMRIKSGTVSWPKRDLQFEQDVQPRSSYERYCGWFSFSTGGYLILECNGEISSVDMPLKNAQIIEFALSCPFAGCRKINVANKTNSEFTKGSKTYNDMQDGEIKIEYWVQGGVHYMARADIVRFTTTAFTPAGPLETEHFMWRFVVQDFDPAEGK